LASQAGNLVNFSELSSTLGISLETVKNYLWYLEKTFILQKITPYFQNLRKEISKAPVYYFSDLGLRNYALGRETNGFLFQNFVFNILKEKYPPEKIHFWRTKDGGEIDFVIETPDWPLPLETKASQLKEAKIPRCLKNFIKKYQPPQAFVVNLTLEKTFFLGKTKISFLPFWKLFAL
jgi:predicted AAA+ superfamily ATPase